MLVALVGIFYEAYQTDEKNLREHPEKVGVDSRTGRKTIDLSKPLWISAGYPVCPSQAEVDALQSGANSGCIKAPNDIPVTEMEMFGFLSPSYRVRPRVGAATDLYVPLRSLSNDPSP